MEAFVVVVPATDAELAADHLFQLGVTAVEERASGRHGHVELWTEVGDTPESIAAAAESLPATWSWRTATVDDTIAGRWRDHATPTWVTDDVVIVPSWLDDPDRGGADRGGPLAIRIDPGAAFGMGDHPTTQLTMRSLLDELEARLPRSSVLDVGCGSGVLAITAALRRAAPVVAVDIATAAVEATVANAAANGVGDIVTASTTPLAEVDGAFDILLANVLAPALVELAPDLRRLVAADGVLVISGILADRHDHVLDALTPMTIRRTLRQDGWVAVTLAP